MEEYLLGLHQQGTPTGEIMKAALNRACDLASRYSVTAKGNVLILNMDHYSRTKLELNKVLYHRQFRMQVWPFVLNYGIWVFDFGTVDHTACDGGWVNWSMMGHHDKNGGFVKFYPRE